MCVCGGGVYLQSPPHLIEDCAAWHHCADCFLSFQCQFMSELEGFAVTVIQ